MADGTLDISFVDTENANTLYSFSFDTFADETLPGQWISQAAVNYSSYGNAYLTGPAQRQRRMWAVNAVIPATSRASLEALYGAWDAVRATGSGDAFITLVDGLLAADTTEYTCAFSSPPAYSTFGRGRSRYLIVSTVLMEL